MNPRGRIVHGQMDAINLVDLEMRLKRMNLDFINGKSVERAAWVLGAGVPRREIINFCFHLEQLTRAGVPIIEALTDLRDSLNHPRFREVVTSVIESIGGGRTFSSALAEHPRVFDQVFVSLVRAGENTGRVPEVLSELSESLKWEDELASHTKKLLIYPSIVATVVVIATIVVMVYLVPQLASFFQMTGEALPTQTVILLAISQVFVGYWWLILAIPMVAVIALRAAIQVNPLARRRFDAFKLRLPMIGVMLQKIILSRFASVLAMMYSSGIPLIDAVRTTEDVVGNTVVREGIQEAGRLISEGQNVTDAFAATGMFPPLVIRMLRVGQNTGALHASLANVSYFYNRDVRESIEKFQAMIEPTLTLVLGMLFLWVMMSVLGPVYDIITRLKF